MTSRRSLGLVAVLATVGLAVAAPEPEHTGAALDREARRILAENCFTCHGPDEKTRKAGLRLDAPNRAVIPGDILASTLNDRIARGPSAPGAMPPPSSGKVLTAAQIATLRRWIGDGARYTRHWAFVAPTRPTVPKVSGTTNAVDAFIGARLAKEGLAFSPEADKRTLIRRVTLDLIGLPPTPDDVTAFVNDTAPNAYEKVVDRLLANPHYGERMAIGWLDLARYADTHGYHIDSQRDMYRWRDWVIAAFNANKPYDVFLTEQLAGDLLPSPTRDQQIATGFNRNHPINFEGGAIPEEYLVAYVADRIDTTATAFLGLTLRCGQCHDHKYDPFTQKDYYRLFAYFNNIDEQGLDGQTGNARPFLRAPYPEQEQRLAELTTQVADLDRRLMAKELAGAPAAARYSAQALTDWDKTLAPGLAARLTLAQRPPSAKESGTVRYEPGQISGAASFDGNSALDWETSAGNFEKDKPFSYGCWVWSDGASNALFSRMDANDGVRGWDLYLADGRPMAHFIHRWPDDALRMDATETIPQKQWTHLFVTYDGTGKPSGVKLYINGRSVGLTEGASGLKGSIRTDKPLRLGGRFPNPGFKGKLDDIRLYDRLLTPAEVQLLAETDPLRPALQRAPDQRSPEQQKTLIRYALRATDPEYKQWGESRTKAVAERDALDKEIPTTMVMQEKTTRQATYLLERGQYDKPRDRVEPGLPVSLGASGSEGNNRLAIAHWFTSPTNPLVARVAVNRLWQQLFGVGLVKTSENFGTQGEFPSHPELLDWLAVEFRESGWDVKRLIKQLVLSRTYRQDSRATAALLKRDPENRLLAHAPRLRLPAELVRDQALATSGLLVGKIGGPSVRPYQPPGLWEEMSFQGGFSAQTYVQDHGEKLYRRSLYTFWKRTVPPPSLQTFDAPEREFCIVRRSATNTPLQALVLLNDPTYVEAARQLAERVLREALPAPNARLERLYALVLSRAPRPDETRLLMTVLNRQTSAFRKDPAAAQKLLNVGESPVDKGRDPAELGAWATVCSLVLNLDEAITRG